MDAATTGLVTNAVVLLAGVGIGLAAGYLLFPAIREAKVLRQQLDGALKEQEEYKASVDAHFRKTADLVGQMTRSYAAVYDHLAVGARTFCDDAAAGSKVGFGPLPGTLASPDIEAAAEAAEPSAATDAASAAEQSTVAAEESAAEAVAGAVAEAADEPATEATGEAEAGSTANSTTPRKEDQSA